ncbi:MAG: sigma-70 family RNA polymerase sigma factor, partial [Chitinophagaceae bacterium]|nr:sigma-70 family RNA polymerase sigma factor [Chitinophagaceae bacterium]
MDSLKDAAMEKLYKEVFPFVARTIARLGGDLDTAKDMFHDALIIYIEKQRGKTTSISLSPAAYIA